MSSAPPGGFNTTAKTIIQKPSRPTMPPKAATSPERRNVQSKAQERARERRRAREKAWLEARIDEVGKREAFTNISTNWQSYTPFEMSLLLNREEVAQAAEMRVMRAASFFESLRNMLIIVPIMLTWLSLALAGAAYEQNLSAPKPNGKPFLQQWQEGFLPLRSVHFGVWSVSLEWHGTRWFTFSGFGLTDATLLAIILVCTIAGQVLEVWALQRGARIGKLLDQYLYDLNAKALFQGMETAPDAKTPPWLRELRTDLGHLGDVIDKMNVALDESMERYTEAITQQQQAVSMLVTDTDKIHDSVAQLNSLFQEGAEATRVYKQYIPGVTKDFANLVNTQQRSTRSLEAMVEMLAKSMRYLGDVTNHLRDAQVTLDRYQDVVSSSRARRSPASHPLQGEPFVHSAPAHRQSAPVENTRDDGVVPSEEGITALPPSTPLSWSDTTTQGAYPPMDQDEYDFPYPPEKRTRDSIWSRARRRLRRLVRR